MKSCETRQSNHLACRIMRLPEVMYLTGLSRSSIYSLQSQKKFPRGIKLSDRAVGWSEAQIEIWLNERKVEVSI